MKISWRIWILTFALAFSLVSILNIPPAYSFLLGILVLAIPFTLTFSNSKTGRTLFLLGIAIAVVAIIFLSAQKGVIVSSVSQDSTYFQEGLRKGMIITGI